MTGDLIRVQAFQGIPVRVAEHDSQRAVPVIDIADALKINRSGLHKLLKRHARSLGKYTCMVKMSTQGDQARETVCITHPGFIGLMAKVKSGACKDPGIEDRIIAFQQWGFEMLSGIMRGERVQTVDIKAELERAREFAVITSGDIRQFQAAVFRKYDMPEYAEALLESVPPLIHGETGWFTAGALGDRCGLNAREVNSYLYNHGYQYPQGPVWRLQPIGEEHGQEYWFEATSGHREIRIRWRESILLASGLIRHPTAAAQDIALAHG